ncbi:MAG: ROK family protein [Lachnospiraceae bacterium]
MYLVIDVGGTYIKYTLMDKEGTMGEKGKLPTPCKPGTDSGEFVELIGRIYDKYKKTDHIQGIAMSLPGQIDVDNGIVYGGGNLVYLDQVHLGERISKRCDHLPVSLENDAKCAALAEVWKGNASDCEDAILFVFGTGVGGAVVKNRRIHRGKHLSAGEFSFFLSDMKRRDIPNIMQAEGRDIPIEEYIDHVPFIASSRIAVAALCNQVAHLKGIPYSKVNGEMIYRWVDEGDESVMNILEDLYFNIAKECCNMQAAFDPQVILIGGGISAEPRFIQGIQRYVDQLKKLTIVFRGITIKPCKFLNDSNLIGAMYHFMQMYGK